VTAPREKGPAVFAVLGVPRSGTSAVAGALHHLGVPMGNDFVPADDRWAPRGFFEDVEFANVHSDLLFPDEQEAPRQLDGPRLDRYRTLIAERCATGRSWGIKESRLPFLFRHFVEMCPMPVRLIITRRPFHQCVASWSAWRNLSRGHGQQQLSAWLYAVDEAATEFKGPIMEVRFADLLANRVHEVERIASFAGLPPAAAAIQFVDPGLRHF
jgi:hypothetical protein